MPSLPRVVRGDGVSSLLTTWSARFKEWRLRRRRRATAKKKRKGGLVVAFGALLASLLAGFFVALNALSPASHGTRITLDQLTTLAEQRRIVTATFLDEDNRLVGEYSALEHPVAQPKPSRPRGQGAKPAPAASATPGVKPSPGAHATRAAKPSPAASATATAPALKTTTVPDGAGRYWLAYPKSSAAFGVLANTVTGAGATVAVDSQSDKAALRVVTYYLLPLLILASFFGFLFAAGRSSSSGIGDIVSFGTIGKGKGRKGQASSAVTFNDVGSASEAITELREVVDYLQNPAKYEQVNATPPKGVLLFGPPGCGKTLLAKAVAGEAGVPFFSVAGAEFVESLVGVGAARVRDLFARVRAVAPAIVFIDELDAAGRRRGSGGGEGGSDEREQTLNQLLVEMDGFEVSAGIVVMGATNRPDILDPALLRPGRFDRHITIETPDLEGRKEILRLHARGRPLGPQVDLDYIATRTPGFSGADLASVINEATLLTLREGLGLIATSHLEEAIQRVLHGPKRRGRVLEPEETRRLAYHEAGHAVVSVATGGGEDLHRLSVLPRGRGVASAASARSDQLSMTPDEIYTRIVRLFGGWVAEDLECGSVSTGAEDDLLQASAIARDYVGRFGFSEVVGRMRLVSAETERFLGGAAALAEISPATHEQFDDECRRLLASAEQDARRVIAAQTVTLRAIAARLLEEETLEGEALHDALTTVQEQPVVAPRVTVRANGSNRSALSSPRKPLAPLS